MIKEATKKHEEFLQHKYAALISAKYLEYSKLTPSKVPVAEGVYVITKKSGSSEIPYYVGRTKNLRQRLYNNHLMGPPSNARLKKHLVAHGECRDHASAKEFLIEKCRVRWVLQKGFRERGAIEGYVTGLLFPKYGIYEEH